MDYETACSSEGSRATANADARSCRKSRSEVPSHVSLYASLGAAGGTRINLCADTSLSGLHSRRARAVTRDPPSFDEEEDGACFEKLCRRVALVCARPHCLRASTRHHHTVYGRELWKKHDTGGCRSGSGRSRGR